MIEFPISSIQQTFLALVYVVTVLFVQTLLEEVAFPRLSFSKTSYLNIKQMFVRWVLFARRFDFVFRRDILTLIQISFLLTAVAVLPLDGISGLTVERPDLAITVLMAIFYFLRVLSGWRSGPEENWEKALEEILFASSRIFVFLLIVDGAYLGASASQFRKMLGDDWLFLSSPFHLIGFVMGVFLVGFFQGRQEFRKNLSGLSLFAWRAEPVLWITLLLVTFLNTSIPVGPTYYVFLSIKCILISLALGFVRSHMPRMRMDQFEKAGLRVVYPIAILAFLGMWWQETLK